MSGSEFGLVRSEALYATACSGTPFPFGQQCAHGSYVHLVRAFAGDLEKEKIAPLSAVAMATTIFKSDKPKICNKKREVFPLIFLLPYIGVVALSGAVTGT